MDIHFISTLTPDDEDRYAPWVLNAVRAILEQLPIAYTVRIRTGNAHVFQYTKSGLGADRDREAGHHQPVLETERASVA
jgi:hypothetical protein